MRAFTCLGFFGATVLTACGGGGDSGGPSTPVDIDGTWNYSVTVSNSTVQVSCNTTGTMVINQAGDQATGTYSGQGECNGPGGSTGQQPVAGNVSGGKINGNKVSFGDQEGCSYSGTASGTPTNAMGGNASCVVGVQGTNYTFRGTWSASR